MQAARTDFIIEPHIRFKGEPGEQATMFFLDPSGNAIEFKAFEHIENLFAKWQRPHHNTTPQVARVLVG